MKNLTQTQIAVLVIAVLAISFFIVTNVFVDSAPDTYKPDIIERTFVNEIDAQYYVTAGDQTVYVHQGEPLSQAEALEHCESVAYAPDYMWMQVVCTYEDEEIYNDIFIAG